MRSARPGIRKIAITTGDVDGIGLEISLKALLKIGPHKSIQFHLYMEESPPQFLFTALSSLRKKFNAENLTIQARSDAPALWVKEAAELCRIGEYVAMVTAPLSKTSILSCGLSAIGHTDILKSVSGMSSLFMTFVGHHFNVLLATGHHSIRNLPNFISEEIVLSACMAAHNFVRTHGKDKSLPLALVGVNPHAGEQGLLGDEEIKVLTPVLAKLRASGIKIEGPLVPDAAFLKTTWKKYSMFVCMYHDQGLIPFKMAHGLAGVHITVGLPFIRTSVDHGTAKDIFGLNVADPQSMKSAILWSMQLSQRS